MKNSIKKLIPVKTILDLYNYHLYDGKKEIMQERGKKSLDEVSRRYGTWKKVKHILLFEKAFAEKWDISKIRKERRISVGDRRVLIGSIHYANT